MIGMCNCQEEPPSPLSGYTMESLYAPPRGAPVYYTGPGIREHWDEEYWTQVRRGGRTGRALTFDLSLSPPRAGFHVALEEPTGWAAGIKRGRRWEEDAERCTGLREKGCTILCWRVCGYTSPLSLRRSVVLLRERIENQGY